jgi:hypothetical protein
MSQRTKIIIVAAVCAVGSFLLSRVIWPDAPEALKPAGTLVPFFIILSILESLIFGVGVSFLVFGWRRVAELTKQGRSLWPAFIATAWLMVSWWPHDNMHRVNPEGNFVGLLRIEYLFHVTLIIAGFIVARYLWMTIRALHDSQQ